MRFNLLENGLNSLQYSVKFYEEYLHGNEKYQLEGAGKLKLTIICLHNSIEVLLKEILNSISELLIYKNVADQAILNALRSRQENTFLVMNIHEILLLRDSDIQTINYNECLKRVKEIFDISDRDYNNLLQLGLMRNKITHFGIDKQSEIYQILRNINRAYRFVLDFIFKKIDKDKIIEEIHLNGLYEEILDLEELGEYLEEDLWSAHCAEEFIFINELIDELVINERYVQEIFELNLKLSANTGNTSDASTFTIFLKTLNNDFYLMIHSMNIPEHFVTLIVDDNDYCHGFIDHNMNFMEHEKFIYIYKTPILYFTESEEIDFNRMKKENKHSLKKLNQEELFKVILRSIKHYDKEFEDGSNFS